jgi:hypothetical protein
MRMLSGLARLADSEKESRSIRPMGKNRATFKSPVWLKVQYLMPSWNWNNPMNSVVMTNCA